MLISQRKIYELQNYKQQKKIKKNIDLKLFHRTQFYSFIPYFYADTVKDKTNKIQKLRKNILMSYVNTLCSAEEQEGRLGICQPCLNEQLSIEKLCIILLIHKTQTESHHRRLKSTSQSSKPIVNAPNIWIFVDFLLCFICFRWLMLIQHTVTSIGTTLI